MRLPDYHLTFDHPQLAGVEVTMGRLSIGEVFEFQDILAMPTGDREALRAYTEALSAYIGAHMIAWNLEGADGTPLPTGQVTDMMLLGAIRDGWLEGINGGRPRPLDPPAGIEASLPVQPLPEPSGSESAPAGS